MSLMSKYESALSDTVLWMYNTRIAGERNEQYRRSQKKAINNGVF